MLIIREELKWGMEELRLSKFDINFVYVVEFNLPSTSSTYFVIIINIKDYIFDSIVTLNFSGIYTNGNSSKMLNLL